MNVITLLNDNRVVYLEVVRSNVDEARFGLATRLAHKLKLQSLAEMIERGRNVDAAEAVILDAFNNSLHPEAAKFRFELVETETAQVYRPFCVVTQADNSVTGIHFCKTLEAAYGAALINVLHALDDNTKFSALHYLYAGAFSEAWQLCEASQLAETRFTFS
jgi:hypothetical protein